MHTNQYARPRTTSLHHRDIITSKSCFAALASAYHFTYHSTFSSKRSTLQILWTRSSESVCRRRTSNHLLLRPFLLGCTQDYWDDNIWHYQDTQVLVDRSYISRRLFRLDSIGRNKCRTTNTCIPACAWTGWGNHKTGPCMQCREPHRKSLSEIIKKITIIIIHDHLTLKNFFMRFKFLVAMNMKMAILRCVAW